MSSASFVEILSRFVLSAVILSVVSLSFSTLYHLFLIPFSSGFAPLMTQSHLSTQVRWAASDRMICRSLRVARSFSVGCGACSPSSCILGSVRQPIPRIVPRFMLGQSSGVCGQVCCARFHTVLHDRALQRVSM